MAKDFFSEDDRQKIVDAIGAAEKNTSGEIRVHVENHCRKPIANRALEIFNILNMHETAHRYGVLFYLAVKDRKFFILGDDGIDAKVPPGFWDAIKDRMEALFRDGKFTEGLCEGIKMAGEQLGKHFPIGTADKNELPDDISFGDS